jgi:hypothetical protein
MWNSNKLWLFIFFCPILYFTLGPKILGYGKDWEHFVVSRNSPMCLGTHMFDTKIDPPCKCLRAWIANKLIWRESSKTDQDGFIN